MGQHPEYACGWAEKAEVGLFVLPLIFLFFFGGGETQHTHAPKS